MPKPLFEIPIADSALTAWTNATGDRLEDDRLELEARSDLGEVDKTAKKLKIYVEFKDFRAKFMAQTKFLTGNMRADVATKPPYVTPEYKLRSDRLLDEGRDAFRAPGFNYPVADKSGNTGITGGMTQSQGVQQVMGGNDGMCLATSHNDLVSKKLLHDALDSGDFFGGGPGMLFIEELPTVLQEDLNAYLAAPGNVMSKALKAKVDELDQQLAKMNQDYALHPTSNWTSVLAKAQEKGVKIYGIDGGDADPGVESSSDGFPEKRVAKMNKLAADVMAKAIKDNPGVKFVAAMGGAHANTHTGGIPGLAQVFDVPVLRADANNGGKLVGVPDDTTKRGMPPKEQQAFIDAYIRVVEAAAGKLDPAVAAQFRGKTYANANALAGKLASAGALVAGADIGKLVQSQGVKDQSKGLSDLMKAWPVPPNAPADPTALARLAVMADMPAELTQLARNYPNVLTDKDKDDQTALHWAARIGRADCITTLYTEGADVDAVDKNGMSPVHLAVERRRERDDPRAQDQANALQALLGAGAYADAQDSQGKTPAHYAALNNNTWSLDKLHAGGAHLDITDQRGWTPVDVAVGSTKVEAEKFFYDKAVSDNPALLKRSDVSVDTIEALMRATRCEKPADLQKVRDAYEKLYAIKELRPVLELLALDALAPRDPENGGGLRIYVADDDNVGKLYASRDSTSPGGAYDEGSHVTMVSSNVAGDFAGTLIHEMTHAAVRLIYGDEVVPFDDNSKDSYEKAISTDVRNTALLLKDKGPLEKDVMDRMSGRMGGYVAKYQKTAQKTVNQEFIVGVPQLIAQYGPDEVRKLAPGMTSFFQGGFTQALNAKRNDPKYATVKGKIDDTALQTLPVPPKSEGTRLNSGPGSIDDALTLVRNGYIAQYGDLPDDQVIYKFDQVKLKDGEKDDFDVRMARVEKVMRKTFLEQGLPPDMSADSMRALAIELGATIRNTAKPKDLDDIVAARATTWTRDVKIQHVEYCTEKNLQVSDRALAEAIVIRAENLVWMEGAKADGGDHLAVEVDPKKHRELVQALERDLANTSDQVKGDPEALMKRLSASLAGDKSKGFYRKGEKRFGSRDPDHVSIDVDHAKRTWINELRVMLARG